MPCWNVDPNRCEALFASRLQPSDRPSSKRVRMEVARVIRTLGDAGCAALVAQEFGDHPDTAPDRMRWARLTVAEVFADASSDSGQPPRPEVSQPSRRAA